MPTQDFQLVTDEFRIEIETKILQGTSWDRRHCAQGGTDSAGRSWGCRNLGVRHIGGEWLCAHCADEVPDPTEVTHLSCPDCRPTGLLTRPTAPGQYYWCNTCHEEWRTDGPDHTRPPIGDILFIITWLAYSMGLFFLLMLTAGIWLRDHTNVNHDTLIWRALLLAIPSWFIAVLVSWRIFQRLQWATWTAWRYTWGTPLNSSAVDDD